MIGGLSIFFFLLLKLESCRVEYKKLPSLAITESRCPESVECADVIDAIVILKDSLWVKQPHPDSCLTLHTATSARMCPTLIGIQFHTPLTTRQVPSHPCPCTFWLLVHYRTSESASHLVAACLLSQSISFIPLTSLESVSLAPFSTELVLCPLLCSLSALCFLSSPADTGSLSALCSEWQQTQAAASLSQLPAPNPSSLPTCRLTL